MQNSVPSTWPYSKYSQYVETSLHTWHIQRLGKSGGKKYYLSTALALPVIRGPTQLSIC